MESNMLSCNWMHIAYPIQNTIIFCSYSRFRPEEKVIYTRRFIKPMRLMPDGLLTSSSSFRHRFLKLNLCFISIIHANRCLFISLCIVVWHSGWQCGVYGSIRHTAYMKLYFKSNKNALNFGWLYRLILLFRTICSNWVCVVWSKTKINCMTLPLPKSYGCIFENLYGIHEYRFKRRYAYESAVNSRIFYERLLNRSYIT